MFSIRNLTKNHEAFEWGGDLGGLAMRLQIERYNILGIQLREELDGMKKRNDWLKSANDALAQLRVNRPINDKMHAYGEITDPQGNKQTVYAWMLKNHIPVPYGINSGSQQDFDAAISNVKAAIDTANSDSQMALIHLQSLMDKVNQCVQLTTNLVAKDGKVKENVMGNIR